MFSVICMNGIIHIVWRYMIFKSSRAWKTQIRATKSHIRFENRWNSTDSARISDPGVKLCPLRHFITSGGAPCFCSKALWQNQSETRLFRLLRLSAGGKLSSPLTSEGQPEKKPSAKKTIPFPQSSWASGRKNSRIEVKRKMKESC